MFVLLFVHLPGYRFDKALTRNVKYCKIVGY